MGLYNSIFQLDLFYLNTKKSLKIITQTAPLNIGAKNIYV